MEFSQRLDHRADQLISLLHRGARLIDEARLEYCAIDFETLWIPSRERMRFRLLRAEPDLPFFRERSARSALLSS
jgi:hypothetical protein